MSPSYRPASQPPLRPQSMRPTHPITTPTTCFSPVYTTYSQVPSQRQPPSQD
ncbi:hypothetical protein BDW22DRAFT_1359826 [Trametopsis cervina]|nr:hypothetical protein BDW22DRAFT_1359826 [Trametopsis cervina]